MLLSSLKGKKSGGPDGLSSEHLKEGGSTIVIWLLKIFNAVREMESSGMGLLLRWRVPTC